MRGYNHVITYLVMSTVVLQAVRLSEALIGKAAGRVAVERLAVTVLQTNKTDCRPQLDRLPIPHFCL